MYQRYSQLPMFFLKAMFQPQSNANCICVAKRWAGHNKWSNIKHTKMSKDLNKSITFQRITKKITLSVKEGGENPDLNYKLKNLIEDARKANIPNATIQNAIKNAKSSSLIKPYWLAYSSPNGLMVVFEVVSASPVAVYSKINQQGKKIDLKLQKNTMDLYVEKGIIICESPNSENSYEKAVEDAIEAGMEEVTESDDKMLNFECSPNHIENGSKKLEQIGYKIQTAKTEIEFNNYITVDEKESQIIYSVLEKVQTTVDDVIRIVDNISGTKEEMSN